MVGTGRQIATLIEKKLVETVDGRDVDQGPDTALQGRLDHVSGPKHVRVPGSPVKSLPNDIRAVRYDSGSVRGSHQGVLAQNAAVDALDVEANR